MTKYRVLLYIVALFFAIFCYKTSFSFLPILMCFASFLIDFIEFKVFMKELGFGAVFVTVIIWISCIVVLLLLLMQFYYNINIQDNVPSLTANNAKELILPLPDIKYRLFRSAVLTLGIILSSFSFFVSHVIENKRKKSRTSNSPILNSPNRGTVLIYRT